MILEKICGQCNTLNVFKFVDVTKRYECIGCKAELVNPKKDQQ